MAVKIISDLHSATDPLAAEVGEHDELLLLGDLINLVDYSEMDGLLVDVFGVEAVRKVVELRTSGRVEEARAVMAERRQGREEDIAQRFTDLARAEYEQVRDALPGKTYLILGNTDWPSMAEETLAGKVETVDGKVIDLHGIRIGFVGGGLPTPLRVAGEIPEEEYNAKLDGLGDVDVLCSHVPPDIPELTFDTLAERHERGSPRLLEYIREVQPLKVYFGHIHQPLISSAHLGRTHLINVGYFRRTRRAFTLRVEEALAG
jgi:Icc-related predicted phosphoesterase